MTPNSKCLCNTKDQTPPSTLNTLPNNNTKTNISTNRTKTTVSTTTRVTCSKQEPLRTTTSPKSERKEQSLLLRPLTPRLPAPRPTDSLRGDRTDRKAPKLMRILSKTNTKEHPWELKRALQREDKL